jgi:hypothetical protein
MGHEGGIYRSITAAITPADEKSRPPEGRAALKKTATCKEEPFVLGRPGSDLLSQGLSHSTIGAEEFNGRVRDGIGFKLLARTTRPAKDKDTKQAIERDALGRMEQRMANRIIHSSLTIRYSPV